MRYWFLLIHYSELKEEYDSVGLPCRIECTTCGSPPCPILNFIYYILVW